MFRLLWNAAMNIHVKVFVWTCIQFFWSCAFSILLWMLGHMLTPCLIIWGASRLFSRVAILFIVSPAVVFHFRHLHRYFVIVCLFDYSYCYWSEWYLLLVWICISLMVNDIEHILMCLLTIRMYIFFEEMSIQIFRLFDNWF